MRKILRTKGRMYRGKRRFHYHYDNGVKGKFRFIDPYHTYWLHNNRLLLTDRGLTYLLSGEYINGQPYFFDGSKITCDLSTVTFTGFYDCKK